MQGGLKQSILKQSLVIGVVIGVLTYNDIWHPIIGYLYNFLLLIDTDLVDKHFKKKYEKIQILRN